MAGIVDISRTRAAARSRTPVGEPEGGPFGDEMEVAIGVEQGRIGIDGDSRDQAVHESPNGESRLSLHRTTPKPALDATSRVETLRAAPLHVVCCSRRPSPAEDDVTLMKR